MNTCETRLDTRALTATVVRIAAMAGDADPKIRESVAQALSRMASSRARAALENLARDRFEAGTTCTATDDGKETCEPAFPVRSAAKEALKELTEAEGRRRKQASEPPKRR